MQPIFLPSTSPIFMQSLKTRSKSQNSELPSQEQTQFVLLGEKMKLSETRGYLQVAVWIKEARAPRGLRFVGGQQ